MFHRLLDFVSLGCHHRRITKPFSAVRQTRSDSQWERVDGTKGDGHYVVCLYCGKKFAYDWTRMRIVR